MKSGNECSNQYHHRKNGNDDAEDELHNSQYDFTDHAESHISQPSHQSDEG